MTGNALGLRLLLSLCITLATELPLGRLLFRFSGEDLTVCALINGITNPACVLLFTAAQAAFSLSVPGSKGVLEAAVVLCEGVLCKKHTALARPFLCSLVLNACSFGLGLALQTVF